MFSLYRDEDQVTMIDARKYVGNSLSTLVYFVENVQLKQSTSSYKYELCSDSFLKAAKLFGCKVIRPLRKLCLRMLEKQIGLNVIHLTFLKIIIHFSCPLEGLEVIEKKAIPKDMQVKQYYEYLYYSSVIYTLLKKYKEANMLLQKVVMHGMEERKIEKTTIKALKMHIIFNQALGKKNISEVLLKEYEQKIKMNILQWETNQAKYLSIYSAIAEGKQIKDEEQLAILEQQRLLEEYFLINYKERDLREKIKEEINLKNERIKTKEIGGFSLDSLEVMKAINRDQKLCRYDPQSHTLYFNHEHTNTEVNSIISRCFEMYEIISNERQNPSSSKHSQLAGLMSMFSGRMAF